MLVRSQYIKMVKPFIGLDVVKVITGIRRSGKSVLLGQIQDEIADDTIGKPASGGGVRLLEDDIAWMSENMLIDTMVVVY